MKLTQEQRHEIHNKYNGKCAYCGCNLNFLAMQVDHIKPLMRQMNTSSLKGTDTIDNMNPSCRSCNYHKSTYNIEEFRNQIKLKIDRVRNSNIKLLERYGLCDLHSENDVVFHYEKI